MILAAESLHFQLFGCNSGFQHRPEIIEHPPLYLSRWVITLRETIHLQESGFQNLKERQNNIIVVGHNKAYTVGLAWNPSPDSAETDPIPTDDEDATSTAGPQPPKNKNQKPKKKGHRVDPTNRLPDHHRNKSHSGRLGPGRLGQKGTTGHLHHRSEQPQAHILSWKIFVHWRQF
jgi:hypothetical protein